MRAHTAMTVTYTFMGNCKLHTRASSPQKTITQKVCGFLKGAHGKGTLQLGFAGSGQAGGRGVAGGFGLAFDRSGNVAGYAYGGAGPGSGLSGVLGGSVQASTARFVSDLKGFFANASASFGGGPAGSADAFVGSSDHGDIAGGGFTLGAGSGDSIFGGATFTVETPSVNLYKLAASALGC